MVLMDKEAIGNQTVGNQSFSLYCTYLSDGRKHYVAETEFSEGEIVLLDHRNLSVLLKKIWEVTPVMELARRLE